MPQPARNGFQQFTNDLVQNLGANNNDWKVTQFIQAWKGLTEEDRTKWNALGNADALRYEQDCLEWKQNGGEIWDQQVQEVIKKPAHYARVIGAEMRKLEIQCSFGAARLMTTAVQVFIATLARESICCLQAGNSEKQEITVADIQRVVAEQDACFGFLGDHLSDSAIEAYRLIVTSFDQEEPSEEMVVAVAEPIKTKKEPREIKRPRQSVSNPKLDHKPKLDYSSAAKIYEARNGESGVPFAEAPNQKEYFDEFRAMKEAYEVAEQKWKLEYPDEYQLLIRKREDARLRSQKRKERLQKESAAAAGAGAASGGNAHINKVTLVHESPIIDKKLRLEVSPTTPLAGVNASSPTSDDSPSVATNSVHQDSQQQQPQQLSREATNSSNLAVVSIKPQTFKPPRLSTVEDKDLKFPWKKVQVMNSLTALVEDTYYWNTATNATSWDRPI